MQMEIPGSLAEYTGGHYKTDPTEFEASIGEKFKLKITTRNGEEFESDFAEILPVPEIDSVIMGIPGTGIHRRWINYTRR